MLFQNHKVDPISSTFSPYISEFFKLVFICIRNSIGSNKVFQLIKGKRNGSKGEKASKFKFFFKKKNLE